MANEIEAKVLALHKIQRMSVDVAPPPNQAPQKKEKTSKGRARA